LSLEVDNQILYYIIIVTILNKSAVVADNLRMTVQRQIILDQVRANRSHSSADDVFQRVRHKLPRISLGTVYRNLEILSEQGLIKKLGPPGKQMRFDGNIAPHYHIRCVACDKIEDLQVRPVDHLQERVSAVTNYVILGHEVDFWGLCPDCQTSPDQSENNQEDHHG